MLNVVAIMGRLVADPELGHTTQPGSTWSVSALRATAISPARVEQRQADFIDVVAWRQTAEFVSKYFQKGSLIAIEGSIQSRQYQDKNGNNRTAVEIVANNVSFAGSKGSNQGGGAYQNVAPVLPEPGPCPPPLWKQLQATLPAVRTTSPSLMTAMTCRSDPNTVYRTKIQQEVISNGF